MTSTEADTMMAIIGLIGILLGIAIPIAIFWVLIIWCSKRKRKRMAEFDKTPAAPEPVADEMDAHTVAALAPVPDTPTDLEKGTSGEKYKDKTGSDMKSLDETEGTGKTGGTGTGTTGTTGTLVTATGGTSTGTGTGTGTGKSTMKTASGTKSKTGDLKTGVSKK